MRESLRVRLVLWYALVLTLVIGSYGGGVVYQSWRSRIAAVDTELDGYARELGDALRAVERGRFDLELPAGVSSYFFRHEGTGPYYVIWSSSGELIDHSDPNLRAGRWGTVAPGRREVVREAAAGATVLVGRDIADLRREQWTLVLIVLIAGCATLVLAIAGGWFVAGRALAPITRISRAAREMSAGDLDVRIPVEATESELEQVAATLNDAFDRLRLAVEHERRFTADASHELRTPISVLRAEAEWALDRQRTPEQYKNALVVCRRAARRMQDAVDRMVALVRAEAIHDIPEPVQVAVHALIADVLEWLAPLAQERDVRLAGEGSTLVVSGDPEQLREAINNVVANAIVYNRPGGSVTISTRESGGAARIEVVDTGIGIPAEAMPHLFDRFFRVDKARSHAIGGSGLGLAIARAIVTTHGGEITCSSAPGTGSVFVISLPVLTAEPSLCSSTAL